MFTKLLEPLLALHLIMLIPGKMHSWAATKVANLQLAGERLEDHIRTIDLLLQKFSNTAGCWMDEHLRDTQNWMEDYMGTLTKLVSDHAQSLCEWLKEHAQDVIAWLNINFGTLQECQSTYTKDSGYELGTEIIVHDEYLEKPINQSDMWLDKHAHIALGEWLGEDLPNFYEGLEMHASSVSSSLEDYALTHIQVLEDHVEMLEQLWNSCEATVSMWLEEHNTAEEASFQKYIWKFLNMGLQTEEQGSAEAEAQQVKCFSVMKWLEQQVGALEQWL